MYNIRNEIRISFKYILQILLFITILIFIGYMIRDKKIAPSPSVSEETTIPAIENVYQTSTGAMANSYYVIKDGILWGYGDNQYGQLGNGQIDTSEIYYTDPVKIAEDVVHVDTTCFFVIYLTKEHKLYGMGRNNSGQLGQSLDGIDRKSPDCYISTPVLIADDVKYAVSGLNFILVLKQDGTLYGLGDNANGQLGDGTAKAYPGDRYAYGSSPYSSELLPIMKNIAYIECGCLTAAAIRDDGTLFTWGDNAYGEIGNHWRGNKMPTVSSAVVAEPCKVMEKIEEIHFKDEVVYATDFDGNKYVWGKDHSAVPTIIENKQWSLFGESLDEKTCHGQSAYIQK